jgi:heme/copper-type cytochrome/quinol oxidase subunit 2
LNNISATSLWTVVLMVVTWWKIPNDRKSRPDKRAFDNTTAKQIYPTIFLFLLVIWISFENIWVNDINSIRKEQTMYEL